MAARPRWGHPSDGYSLKETVRDCWKWYNLPVVSGEDLAKLEVGGCEDVDVSEVRGSGLLRGAAAVPGPRLAPRLPPVRGVRQGPQPRHTRGGEPEHVQYTLSWCLAFVSIYILYLHTKYSVLHCLLAPETERVHSGPWRDLQFWSTHLLRSHKWGCLSDAHHSFAPLFVRIANINCDLE